MKTQIYKNIDLYLKNINRNLNKLYNQRVIINKKIDEEVEKYENRPLYYKHVLELGVNIKIKHLNFIKLNIERLIILNKEIRELKKEKDSVILTLKKIIEKFEKQN